MALLAEGMQAVMLANALAAGLFDKPPEFALSRVYGVIAKGVVATVQTPLKTITTVVYAGQPAVGFGTATALGLSGMDPDSFRDRALVVSLFLGPFAVPFFEGLKGIVQYLAANTGLLDLLAPIGSVGFGNLLAGGIVLDPAACFDNLHTEAVGEKLMVVRQDVHLGGDPDGVMADPTTQEPLRKDALFAQARQLLLAVSTQLPVELAKAQHPAIPVTGLFLPEPVPPIGAATITTVLL